MDNNRWKIRLLGGVLHGREVLVTYGRLTLGERGCDLCIPLRTTGKVVLTVKDGKLFADAGEAAMRVNGRRYKRNKVLPVIGVLQTSGLTLAFGSETDNLTEIRVPIRSGVVLLVGGGLVLGLLFLASVLLVKNTGQFESDLSARMEALFSQHDMMEVTSSWSENGLLTLSGYCRNSIHLQAAREKLNAWGVLFQDQVVRGDQLERDVQDVLLQAGYVHVQVASIAPHEVSIRGAIMMGKQWTSTLSLLQEIPGLRHCRIENTHDVQGNAIIAVLAEEKLVDSLSLTKVEQAFVISGVLDDPRRAQLEKTLVRLRQRYPDVNVSYQPVPASLDGACHLPASVVGIIDSRNGQYLVLEDGQRLQTGSQLPDGGEVLDLSNNAVAIKYQGVLINYPLNF